MLFLGLPREQRGKIFRRAWGIKNIQSKYNRERERERGGGREAQQLDNWRQYGIWGSEGESMHKRESRNVLRS